MIRMATFKAEKINNNKRFNGNKELAIVTQTLVGISLGDAANANYNFTVRAHVQLFFDCDKKSNKYQINLDLINILS